MPRGGCAADWDTGPQTRPPTHPSGGLDVCSSQTWLTRALPGPAGPAAALPCDGARAVDRAPRDLRHEEVVARLRVGVDLVALGRETGRRSRCGDLALTRAQVEPGRAEVADV